MIRSSMSNGLAGLLAVVAMTTFAAPAWAGTGRVSGTVWQVIGTRQSPGAFATVTLVNNETNRSFATARADSQGRYTVTFRNLPVGTYRVEARKDRLFGSTGSHHMIVRRVNEPINLIGFNIIMQ